MDLNDLKARLDRMNHAVGQMKDFEVQAHPRTKRRVRNRGGKREIIYETDFNARGQTEAELIVLQAIAAISSLKDHIKSKLQAAGKDEQLMEDAINQSTHLSVALDIWNMDKHGTPLTRPPRSGFHPRLANINRALSGGPGRGVFEYSVTTGKIIEADNVTVVLTGTIEDEEGEEVMQLSELIRGCLDDLEAFVAKHPELVAA